MGVYEVEPHEVKAMIASLVGSRDSGESDESWYAHLSAKIELVDDVREQIGAQRDAVVADMVARSSERTVAAVLGLSPTRPGQMARRARASK